MDLEEFGERQGIGFLPFPPGLPLVMRPHFRVGHGRTGIVMGVVHQLLLAGIACLLGFLRFLGFLLLIFTSLAILSQRTRSDLFSDISNLLPVFLHMGENGLDREILNAVRDVSKWWR